MLHTYMRRGAVMDFLGERMNAISDGIMAIIITIMVFSIPVPNEFQMEGVLSFLYNIGIFFISFLIVGMQWIKHCALFSGCDSLTGKILFYNILYLFFLSLMPLFTKWIMTNPGVAVPAIGYDSAFFMLTICYHLLQSSVIKENRSEVYERIREKRNHPYDKVFFFAGVFMITAVIILSFYFPSLSIFFFVGLPLLPSLRYLKQEEGFQQLKSGKQVQKINLE